MLKLVKSHNLVRQNLTDETEKNPPHQLIDELIAQIKYTHLDEVWEARLGELIDGSATSSNLKSKRKHLVVL